MEEAHSFEPSLVIAVGLDEETTEKLQSECSERRIRLLTAGRRGDLPISLKCDVAIVAALLDDCDGRTLAVDFVRAGAKVLVLDTLGGASMADAWSCGAAVGSPSDDPADWLDEFGRPDHVDAVSRAGHLLEPLSLADAVASAAEFAGSTGISVSFLRLSPRRASRIGMDEALDRVTGVIGMTTVFHDTSQGERIILVLNGDRRRMARMLDDEVLTESLDMGIVEVGRGDDLAALLGRSRLEMASIESSPKVLLSLAAGQDKLNETIRTALHRLEIGTILWDSGFKWDDLGANLPVAAIVDARLPNGLARDIIKTAATQKPGVPSLVVADPDDVENFDTIVRNVAADFLLWPFGTGDLQAAIARVITLRGEGLAPVHEEVSPSVVIPEESEEPTSSAFDVEEPEEEDLAGEVEAHVDDEPAEQVAGDGAAVENELPTVPVAPARPPSIQALLVDLIAEKLISGESLTLEGIGVLRVQHETSRIVHDDQGRTIVEPPKRSLKFDQFVPGDDISS